MNKNNSSTQFLRYIPALIIIVISWFLSSQPTLPMPDIQFGDKIVHFICFGGLSFSFALWIRKNTWKEYPYRGILTATALTSAYGIIDEIHQSFVQGRTASVFDWIADTAGAFCGACAFYMMLILIQHFHTR